MDLKPKEIYIDIASKDSPTPEIYQNLYQCQVYRQDLAYPDGVYGNQIGSDATGMPIADKFCDKIALHCSFEHFERDSDSPGPSF